MLISPLARPSKVARIDLPCYKEMVIRWIGLLPTDCWFVLNSCIVTICYNMLQLIAAQLWIFGSFHPLCKSGQQNSVPSILEIRPHSIMAWPLPSAPNWALLNDQCITDGPTRAHEMEEVDGFQIFQQRSTLQGFVYLFCTLSFHFKTPQKLDSLRQVRSCLRCPTKCDVAGKYKDLEIAWSWVGRF